MNGPSATTIPPLEGTLIVDPVGAQRSYVCVFDTRCPVCMRPCHGPGQYLAIGTPNHVLLHRDCAHRYTYPAGWPHSSPAVAYAPSGLIP